MVIIKSGTDLAYAVLFYSRQTISGQCQVPKVLLTVVSFIINTYLASFSTLYRKALGNTMWG